MNARTSNRISATSPQPPHTCHHVSRLHHTCHTPHWPGRGPRKPTKAHSSQEGQRRPTKRKKGPNDASGVVWALGVFFFIIFLHFINNNGPKQLVLESPVRSGFSAQNAFNR